MTKFPDIFAALARPFVPKTEVKQRTQAGRTLDYITARTAMNRLDEVLGPENWWDEYIPGANSVLCKLTIRLPDGQTLTKADAGGYAGMQDEGDDDKSGYSDAFKRAAAKFGVARYLYKDGVPDFAQGQAPAAPAPQEYAPAQPPPQAPAPRQYDNFRIPKPGKAVFAWAKAQEQHFGVTLIREMSDEGKRFGYGGDLTAWSIEQVEDVVGRVVVYLTSLENYKGEFDGKVDLDNIRRRLDAAEHKAGEHDALRARVAELIDNIIEAKTGGQPDNPQRRKVLDEVSARAANSSGHAGEVLQGRLADCADGVWLTNMTRVAERLLKDAKAEAFA